MSSEQTKDQKNVVIVLVLFLTVITFGIVYLAASNQTTISGTNGLIFTRASWNLSPARTLSKHKSLDSHSIQTKQETQKTIKMNEQNIQLLKSVGKWLVTVIVSSLIAAAAYKLVTNYQVTKSLQSVSFLTATVVAITYRVVNPYGWTLVLAGIGYPTRAISSVRVWLLSESNRWLPGGVWGYASRAVQSKQLGVPVPVASGSMLIELLVTMAAAVVVSLLGIMFHYDKLASTFWSLLPERVDTPHAVALAVTAIVACVSLALISRKKFYSKLNSLTERFALLGNVKFNWKTLSKALGYMVLMAVLNGGVNLCLLPAVGSEFTVPALVMIAATAAAWIAGFLAFFSPGGILIREATLAALLLPWLPYESGITLAVLSRIAQLVAEVVVLGIALLHQRKTQTQQEAKAAESKVYA